MKKNDNKWLTIRCDSLFLEKLEAICDVDKKTKSALIREIVNERYNKNREYDKRFWNTKTTNQQND